MLTIKLKNDTTALATDIEKIIKDRLGDTATIQVSSEDICEYDGTIKIVIDIPGTPDIDITGKMTEFLDAAGVIGAEPIKKMKVKRKDVVSFVEGLGLDDPLRCDYGNCGTCTHFGQCMVCGECYSGSRYVFDWKYYLEENRGTIEASLLAKKSA